MHSRESTREWEGEDRNADTRSVGQVVRAGCHDTERMGGHTHNYQRSNERPIENEGQDKAPWSTHD